MANKPGKLDKKHPATARDAMEDINEISGDPRAVRNEIRYMEPNRDRALGQNDRTGRHFDEQRDVADEGAEAPEAPDEGSDVSKEHEAD